MRFLIASLLTLGLCCTIHAQEKNLISTSLQSFYFYDEYPMKISNPSLPIPLNLSYERQIGDHYSLEFMIGTYRLDYSGPYWRDNRSSGRSSRNFGVMSLSAKRYFDWTDKVQLFPTLQFSYRGGQSYYEDNYKMERYRDFGIGLGAGIRADVYKQLSLQFSVQHTKFFHKTKEELMSHTRGTTGSEHQLSFRFSAGISF